MSVRHARRLLALSAAVFLIAASAFAQAQTKPFEPTVGQAGKDVVWVPTPQTLVERMLDLAKLTPQEASRDVGGNSIAAHAHHILFSFEAFGAFISGDRTKRDWNESWRVSAVDAAAWTQLQSDLGARYEELQRTIETHGNASEAATGGALGAVAHLAYHIGAIRQKMAAL